MQSKIIAVDFDDTLFKTAYPKILEPNMSVIEYCKKRQREGDIIILWTCRRDMELLDATRACEKYGLTFDYVNCNAETHLAKYSDDCRKIFADIYIDDKCIRPDEI